VIPILGTPINYKDYTSAQVIAHRVGWFGTPGHVNMNYASSDIAVCDRQAETLVTYGASGVNHDWYGQTGPNALATQRMLDSCERNNLSFSICVDAGAPVLKGLTGTLATNQYVIMMVFLANAFFNSPAYLQDAGRYVVNFFGEPAGVNWTTVRNAVSQRLALVFEGSAGFTHAEADGAFGWVNPTTPASNINEASIQSFLSASEANPSKLAFYPTYAGFDDSMASWGSNRFMSRRLGQTALDTLALIPKSAKYAILPTLDDQEEGSAVEYSQG
jgi:hypothetical protein